MIRFGLGLALWLALLVGSWLLVGRSLRVPEGPEHRADPETWPEPGLGHPLHNDALE